MPQGQTYSFAMRWTYDSWNRTQNITYPDGEVVTYDYDDAGQLQAMSSVKGTDNYAIIDSISYDKFGSRAKIRYGNATRSTYTYESLLHRLSHLKTYDASSNLIQNIEYSYDNVGNIDEIENTAPSVSGLGGEYDYTYDYDSLYRLVSSIGTFTDNGNTDYTYDMGMDYSASGNILTKSMTASTLIAGLSGTIAYNHAYTYNTNQPHTIADIDGTLQMQWDANGNMTQFVDLNNSLNRNMCWDEENRLAAVKDEQNLSGYIYNAGGERVWKITGEVNRMRLNGGQYIDQADLNHKTLYTSPYMVVADEEYTKHYYAGSQRVLTKIGGGLLNSLVDPLQYQVSTSANYPAKADSLWDMMVRGFACAGIEANNINIDIELASIQSNYNEDNIEVDQYFYHSDHLGSSSWITDASGNACAERSRSISQHLQYLPFGEQFIDQRTNHDIRFKFTTKEEDSETGYAYFGARYYDSDLSVWLSVDPLAEKNFGVSPYNYCHWNPIIMIDPDGRDDFKLDKKTGKISKTGNTQHYQDKDGTIISVKEGEKYSGDKDITKMKKFDKLTNSEGKSEYFSEGVLIKGSHRPRKQQFYVFKNEKESERFYYFVADYSDTEWAWGKIKEGREDGVRGVVGCDGNSGSTNIPYYIEQWFGEDVTLISHSHPNTGGPPSFNQRDHGNRVGDLESAANSPLSIQREVYDPVNGMIYGYDGSTLTQAIGGGDPFSYKYLKYR